MFPLARCSDLIIKMNNDCNVGIYVGKIKKFHESTVILAKEGEGSSLLQETNVRLKCRRNDKIRNINSL